MSEYTPTVDQVREDWALSHRPPFRDEAREWFDRMIQVVKAEEREWVADMIRAEAEDTSDGFGFDAYINGLCRAEQIARENDR